jgi:hypothetical protein
LSGGPGVLVSSRRKEHRDRSLVATAFPDADDDVVKPGTSLYLPAWRKSVGEYVDALRDVTAGDLPTLVAADSTFW